MRQFFHFVMLLSPSKCPALINIMKWKLSYLLTQTFGKRTCKWLNLNISYSIYLTFQGFQVDVRSGSNVSMKISHVYTFSVQINSPFQNKVLYPKVYKWFMILIICLHCWWETHFNWIFKKTLNYIYFFTKALQKKISILSLSKHFSWDDVT